MGSGQLDRWVGCRSAWESRQKEQVSASCGSRRQHRREEESMWREEINLKRLPATVILLYNQAIPDKF